MSLLGRIQIVKTFTIPKRMYRASLIALPKGLVKVVNSILYSFMWKGRDKVKRQALILDLKKWGLEMLDIESMIKSIIFSSRQVCEFPLEKKQILCTAKQKLQDKYSDTIVD